MPYLILLVFCLIQLNAPVWAQARTISGVVDFGEAVTQPAINGFLHSLDEWQHVPDGAITALKPSWFRIAAGNIALQTRATRLGGKVELVLSDAYGYPFNHWKGQGAPWENNGKNWERHVRKMGRLHAGSAVYWDIWNEPDARAWNKTRFWSGNRAQFFETYRRAYHILRRELASKAMIGGPSFANYEHDDLVAFLNYCNKNNLEVNFLSWHESGEVGEADADPASIAKHLSEMKKLALAYPRLQIKEVLINESVGPDIHLYTGDILGVLYYLEKGGAAGTNRACWDASDHSNNCYNGSLDGLIVPATKRPRAAWWAYKIYADTLTNRVKATPVDADLALFAARIPALVLLGYFDQHQPASARLILKNLPEAGFTQDTVLVNVYRIPATGEAPLEKPILVSRNRIDVINGNATVNILNLQPHEGYLLKLQP